MLEPKKPPKHLENALLSALPRPDYANLLPYLQGVTLSPGDVLYDSGQTVGHIYFPTDGIIALLYTTERGATIEMGLTGRDGVVGVALFLGGDTTPNRAVVQIAGGAMRLDKKILRKEFARAGSLQRILLRYTQAFITQISQTAACNRLHDAKQRLCRLLLLSQDRLQCDEIAMTQDLLANILGGRRESVALAAAGLQNSGLIHYVRGRISIIDRKGLEATSCECYGVVRHECDRLFREISKQGSEKDHILHS